MEPILDPQAFLRLPAPPGYTRVQQLVEETTAWLESEEAQQMARDASQSRATRKLLSGLPEADEDASEQELQEVLARACEALKIDPSNAMACFLAARALIELSRYNSEVFHKTPLRAAVVLAERSRNLAPKVGKAWQALVECNLYLDRFRLAAELLHELDRLGYAPATHAVLSAKLAERQGLLPEAAEWYRKAITHAAEPARRGELYAAQAMIYVKQGQKDEADRLFLLAFLEAGPNPRIAHQWAVHKHVMGNLPAAAELNRRTLVFDPEYRPAVELRNLLVQHFANAKVGFPGVIPLQEEKLRGIGLPGCDSAVAARENLEPWRAPSRSGRTRPTKTFRTTRHRGTNAEG